MPSSIFDALKGSGGAPAASTTPAVPAGNLLGQLNQFRQMIGPLMGNGSPEQAVRAILQQRGLSPDQIIQQYGAQASEIQKQIMGK